MIRGFDYETAPLSEREKEFLPQVVKRLETAIGMKSAVTSDELCRLVRGLNGARVRKLINYIRQNDIITCLIATSKGYYIAQNKDEIDGYIESLIGREESIKAVRDAIQRQMEATYPKTNKK